MSVARTRNILDAIHNAFFIVDLESDEILDANEEACTLLGYNRAELLSLDVSAVHPNEMDRLRGLAGTAKSDGKALASDLHCLRSDGQKIPIEASACPVEFEGVSGLAVIVRDVSNAQQQNHYFEVLERFLRHNLRNRMSVVLSHAELIDLSVEDESLAEQAEILCQTVTEIIDNIEEIRTVQQCLRNDIDPSSEFDCTQALNQLVADIKRRYPEATVTTSLQDTLSVQSDNRLIVAFDHLVENAIVHNDKNHPNVEIAASQVDSHQYVEIQIIDDGPGIPPAERQVVTNPKENSPLNHGTGLGLWIAAIIVFSIGGDIHINKNEPEGSIVTIQLPQARSITENSTVGT
jgi:PAS domain S-box-containing protein